MVPCMPLDDNFEKNCSIPNPPLAVPETGANHLCYFSIIFLLLSMAVEIDGETMDSQYKFNLGPLKTFEGGSNLNFCDPKLNITSSLELMNSGRCVKSEKHSTLYHLLTDTQTFYSIVPVSLQGLTFCLGFSIFSAVLGMLQFGYNTGIAMALHLPEGRHFVLGVDRDKPLPADAAELQRVVADLQLFAVHAQDAAMRILVPQGLQPERPALTPRELEGLRWTMEGKTAWEVGAILGISERTAVLHVNNAMHKLGCVSKHAAVLKALRLGLIH